MAFIFRGFATAVLLRCVKNDRVNDVSAGELDDQLKRKMNMAERS